MLNRLRSAISPQNPFLLLYHKIIALAAAIWYGFPANRLRVIAVTGTTGKSTTVHLIASILRAAGFRVGVASTIHFQIGENIWMNDTKMTTQGRFALQRLLRKMVRAKCDFAVLEATSQALVQSRLAGVNVDIAVLTNIQRDHLEYHGGFEQYMHAKGLLFAALFGAERKFGLQKTALLPADDANTAYFKNFPADRIVLYGIKDGEVRAEDISLKTDGSRFTLAVPNEHIEINLNLPGDFNVLNALAAAGAAISSGIGLPAIKKGLECEAQIPGRLEAIRSGQKFTVIVDYAHTPEALKNVLMLLKPLTSGRLWLVFGATGGGRDKSKRPEMGRIAAAYADEIIITDDDPYDENRMQLIDQVFEGTGRKEGEQAFRLRDRAEAIRLALTLAAEGDTVLIAGKGSEPIQIIGGERIVWDDRAKVREILSGASFVSL